MMLRLLACCCFLFLNFIWSAPGCAQDGSTPDQSTPGLEALRAHLQALEKRIEQKKAPADLQNLALLKFKVAQAQLLFKNIESNRAQYVLQSPYEETKTEIEAILARAEAIAGAVGDAAKATQLVMQERAYIARADGSAQPYWVFLPQNYTPDKKWPLVVFLHGYSPEISKIKPWIPGPETWQTATSRGFILAVPYGRRNSDFVGIGEDDTLAVTDDVAAHYSTDPARTFLLGTSMGGYGAHAIGMHRPDRFAAYAAMCGRTDFYLWFHLQREDVAPWKRILYDADNPRSLEINAFQLPIFMQHGVQDNIVPIEHSRLFYADLKKRGYPAYFREIEDGTHYIYFEYSTFEVALDWLKKFQKAAAPRRVQYATGALRTNSSYWVSIEGFENYEEPAIIDAEIKNGNVISVQTENVTRFELRPPQQFLKANQPITLVVDGLMQAEKFSGSVPLRWAGEKNKSYKYRKSPRRVGPIKECYRDPFLLVYGTLQNGDDEIQARRFLSEWDDYADGQPPIKADTDVSEEDKKKFNLVLFGVRESNLILKEIAADLPLELTSGGYRVADREYSGEGKTLGLQLCYPSPFSEKRMIVVQSGLFWGSALPVNHKLDLLPEFIVFDDTVDESDQTNHALVAGFFDDNWQLPIALFKPEIQK
jgi:acetyl esterase/lipase